MRSSEKQTWRLGGLIGCIKPKTLGVERVHYGFTRIERKGDYEVRFERGLSRICGSDTAIWESSINNVPA